MGLVTQISGEAVEQGESHGPRFDADGGSLEHLGAQVAQSGRELAGLRARPRYRHHLAVQGATLEPCEPVAQGGDGADKGDRRRAYARVHHATGDVGERPGHRALIRKGAARHHRGRLFRRAPGGGQALGDQGEVLDAHVEHERSGEARERAPIEGRVLLRRVLVARDERDGRRLVSVGGGDAGVGRGRHSGRHAGYHLEGHAGGGECLGLLASAAKDERVAALEADHPLAFRAELHEQLIDLLLLHRGRARLLSDVAKLGAVTRAVECARRNEPVVEDRVGAGDQLERAARHQPGSPGPAPTR